jgi:hypothetical protein
MSGNPVINKESNVDLTLFPIALFRKILNCYLILLFDIF